MKTTRIPVRWKIVAWYVALLTGTLAIFGLTAYLVLRTMLLDAWDEQVRSQTTLALSTVHVSGGQLSLDDSTRADLSDPEHLVRLFTPDGMAVIDSVPAGSGPALSAQLLADANRGDTSLSTVTVSDRSLRVVTAPVMVGGQVVGILQTGGARTDIDETLRTLWIAMAIAAPLVAVMAGTGGYVLAGRALEPVSRITQLARDVNANGLHARLNLDLPDDELGRLARTFDAMLGRIDAGFERQRQFTGDAAHELRTPLSIMRSQVDLALSRPRTSDEYRRAFRELDTDLARTTRLVEILLALARSDSAGIPVERNVVDIGELVALVVDQYTDVRRGPALAIESPPTVVQALADEDLLLQVLINLVDNALAHTEADGTITVGYAADTIDAHLWIRDTGTGIAPPHLGRVFERFYRVDHARSRTQGGAGLGLSICRAIVSAHDGTIDLSSAEGRGTTVCIRFPHHLDTRIGRSSSDAPPIGARHAAPLAATQ